MGNFAKLTSEATSLAEYLSKEYSHPEAFAVLEMTKELIKIGAFNNREERFDERIIKSYNK